jgi:hypothetical protein
MEIKHYYVKMLKIVNIYGNILCGNLRLRLDAPRTSFTSSTHFFNTEIVRKGDEKYDF